MTHDTNPGQSGSGAGKALLAIVVAIVALAAGLGAAYLLVNSSNPTIAAFIDQLFPGRRGAETSSPVPTPTVALEADWTWHEFPEDGFGVGLPSSWEEMGGESEGDMGDLDLDLAEGEHGWMVLDSTGEGPSPVILIVGRVYTGEPLTLDEALDLGIGTSREMTSRRRMDLPSGRTEKITLDLGIENGIPVEGVLYVSVHGEYLYMLVFACLGPEVVEDNSYTFDRIARSFRIMGEMIATPDPAMPSCRPGASFVEDVTVPDGTRFAAGESFTKTWRVESDGCTGWPEGVRLAFESGDQMGGPDSVPAPETLWGSTADLSVNLAAPDDAGTYQGYWQLETPTGERFGVRLLVMIQVP